MMLRFARPGLILLSGIMMSCAVPIVESYEVGEALENAFPGFEIAKMSRNEFELTVDHEVQATPKGEDFANLASTVVAMLAGQHVDTSASVVLATLQRHDWGIESPLDDGAPQLIFSPAFYAGNETFVIIAEKEWNRSNQTYYLVWVKRQCGRVRMNRIEIYAVA